MKKGNCFKILEETKLTMDIGIKNKIKAALKEGSDNALASELVKFSPEVVVNLKLPVLILNATPDVYNAIVNVNQVLSSEGPSEHL